jgi:YggT family protein
VFVFGNLVGVVAWLVNIVLQVLLVVILVNALLSWFRLDPSNPALQLLERVSSFVCNPIRRVFPTVASGIDFAPMIAMVALMALQKYLVPTLTELALRMR